MMPLEEWADLKFHPKGTVHHVVPFDSPIALCGSEPSTSTEWWGTGCWDEREKAKSLPRCKRCAAHVFARVAS